MNSKIAFGSAMLALAATSVHTPLAHALKPSPAQLACENRGYVWAAGKGCADKPCRDPILGSGLPGDSKSVKVSGSDKVYHVTCDGFTGKWTLVPTLRAPTPPGLPGHLAPPTR